MHNTFKRPSPCIVVTENVRADKMNSKKTAEGTWEILLEGDETMKKSVQQQISTRVKMARVMLEMKWIWSKSGYRRRANQEYHQGY